ncbi:MAG: DUF1499 domain-containing protein [Isosphaeraceae bacterium]
MSWTEWFTRNWSRLSDDADDPRLRPLELPIPPAEAVTWAAKVIASAPRWRVLESDPARGSLHATHATLLWRFVDDIRLTFEPHGSGSRLVGESRSRIGKGDLGQNDRNLRELVTLLKRR